MQNVDQFLDAPGASTADKFLDGDSVDAFLDETPDSGQGRLASAGNAFMQGGGVAVGQTLQGGERLLRASTSMGMPEGFETVGGLDDQIRAQVARRRTLTPAQNQAEIQAGPFYRAGGALAEGAKEAYTTNPKFKGEFWTDTIPASAGAMVPTIAAGGVGGVVAGGLQYGLSAGQSEAQAAIDAGHAEAADKVFLLNLGIGATSEGLLGIGANIFKLARAARTAKLGEESAKKIIAKAIAKGATTEAAQEGLEQIGQNAVAGMTYDPERGVFVGVPTAMAAGLVMGGGGGGVAGALGALNARKLPAPSLPAEAELAAQTITGSNVRTGTEMPVQPQPASVGGRAAGAARFIFNFNGNELAYEGVTEEQAKELAFRQNPGATFVRAEPLSPAATEPATVATEQSDVIEYAPWETGGGTPGTSEQEDSSVDYPYSAARVDIEPQTTSELAPDGNKVVAVEFPLAQIEVDPVLVPQFKNDADETSGEVRGEELKGNTYQRPSNPIVIWQLRNGRNIVVTGRHRFALAKRLGEQTIPGTIVREADGFTRQNAITLDAEFNIRDGNGSVDDYANYIENTPQLTEEEARARGLLDRAKGEAAWSLARLASNDLKALYRAGKIQEREAVAIASAAPGDVGTQAIGIKSALAGKSAAFIRNLMIAAAGKTKETGRVMADGEFPWGDDTSILEMEAQAERASQFQKEISEQIRAVQGAAKRPDVARKLGVDVQDPAGIALKIVELKNELARWQNWPLHSDLVAKAKGLPPGAQMSLAQDIDKKINRLRERQENGGRLSVDEEAQLRRLETQRGQQDLLTQPVDSKENRDRRAAELRGQAAELFRRATVEQQRGFQSVHRQEELLKGAAAYRAEAKRLTELADKLDGGVRAELTLEEAPKAKESPQLTLFSVNSPEAPTTATADVQKIVTQEAGDAPVRVIHDATLTHNGQMVEGYLDPNTGQIVINAAAPTMRDPANVRRVIREERAHWLLASAEGQAELRQFAGRLTPAQRATLQGQGYRRQKNESAADYETRLHNEFIAKQARENTVWWRKLVERVREWLAQQGLAKLTNAEAARAILRRLNAAAAARNTARGESNYNPAPQFSLAPVTPVSPETQTQIAVIEQQSGNVNEHPLAPTLATSPELRSKFRDMMGTVSGVIHYYGGASLLRAKRGIDLTASYQAAAVSKQSDALLNQLFSNAYTATSGFKLPQWMKTGAWARRVVAFKKRLLHVAARLNATARNPDGSFKFENFKVRSGLMTMGAFKKGEHTVGDTFMHIDPVTAVQEEFEIGPFVMTPDGRMGHQLYRSMDAKTQAELYRTMQESFPELTWLLDMFIDPALSDVRQTINGIQIPVFNRFAQATMMAEGNPNFAPLTGYTPDVLVSRSLLGAIRGALSFTQGVRSPGRKYKFGTSRESGHVRDLLTGFNIRTFQMLQEKARREWRNEVFKAARPIEGGLVPAGWVKLETGMEELWQAAKRLQNWTSPESWKDITKRVEEEGLDAIEEDMKEGESIRSKNGRFYLASKTYPETEARLSRKGELDESRDFDKFFKEVRALRGKQLMLPQPLVNALLKRYAVQVEHGALYKLGAWAIRNSTQLFLVAPKTYVANVATNDLFALEAATRYGLRGLLAGNTRDLRFARNLFSGMFTNRFAAFRQGTGMFAGSDYMTAIRETLPDQVFADNTSLADVKVRWGHSALDYLRQGEIGGFALQLIQYGQIDVRGKQRVAFAFLKATAVSNAKRAGLKGKALKAAVDRYLINPPQSDRVQAVTIANFELLNYADSPQVLEDFGRNDFSRLVLPFPRFGYHYVTKQLKRLSAAKLFLGKVPKGQRADAFADLVTVGLYGLGGGGIVANALLSSLSGDDDDDARQRIGTSTVPVVQPDGGVTLQPIDRQFVTANRINLSAWARAMGIESDNENDFWLRVRNYPVIAAAGVTALAYNDAKKHGAALGARQFAAGAGDLAMDFFSIGAAVRVPSKVFVEWQSMGKPTPASSPFDPFATGVPLSFYITEQLTDSIIPGSRQADELLAWVNPVRPRRTASKTLGYSPGVVESLESSHWTGLINNLARGGESGLPPAGAIDRRTSTVPIPSTITPTERLSSVLGVNIKAIPRQEYQNAINP